MDIDLNLLDVVLILLMVYALVRGWLQGGVSQLAAFGGAALGLVAGAWASPRIAGLVIEEPGPTLALVTLGLLIVLVLLGQGIGFTIGIRLRRAADLAGIGAFDRIMGVGVGAAGLVLVIWLLSSVLVQGPFPTVAQQMQDSRVVGLIDDTLPPPPNLFGVVAGYLDDQGFPQVFASPGGAIAAPPVPPTSDAAVQAAAQAGQPSTVQIRSTGCGDLVSSGSGFVTQQGFVVTNAHVIAGGERVSVRDTAGEHSAVAIHFDSDLDLAVLRAPDVQASPIAWADARVERGMEGATLGFPGGQRDMVVKPATVRSRGEAVGRDIYGRGSVPRDILDLSAAVQRGDSGGPFVTSEGRVGGVVFAANAAQPGSGFALTVEAVRSDVQEAISRNAESGTGACRF